MASRRGGYHRKADKLYKYRLAMKRQSDKDLGNEQLWGRYRLPILSTCVDAELLQEFFEFSLSVPHDNITLLCGELHRANPDHCQFVLRMMRFIPETEEIKYLEFGMDTYRMLCKHSAVTRSLLYEGSKALVFQNPDVQAYILEEKRSEGYLLHIEDRSHVKISLNPEELLWLVSYYRKINFEFKHFERRLRQRKRKIEKAIVAEMIAKEAAEKENNVEELPSFATGAAPIYSVQPPRKARLACISYKE